MIRVVLLAVVLAYRLIPAAARGRACAAIGRPASTSHLALAGLRAGNTGAFFTTLGQVPAGFREFRAPALGAHYTSLPTLPAVSTPQISLTRVGLTKLLDPAARRGPTDSRITFASQSLTEVVATPTGGPVTVGNPAYLEPVTPFGPGSSFTVTAAP